MVDEEDEVGRRKKAGSGCYFIVKGRGEGSSASGKWWQVCACLFRQLTLGKDTAGKKRQRARAKVKGKAKRDPCPPRRNLKKPFNGVYVAVNKNGHDTG